MDAMQCNRCKKYGLASDYQWKWIRTDIMKEIRENGADLCPECASGFETWWNFLEYLRNASQEIEVETEEKQEKGQTQRNLERQLWHRAKSAKDNAIHVKQATDDVFRLINEIEEIANGDVQ